MYHKSFLMRDPHTIGAVICNQELVKDLIILNNCKCYTQ
jgi:hypothetical protein